MTPSWAHGSIVSTNLPVRRTPPYDAPRTSQKGLMSMTSCTAEKADRLLTVCKAMELVREVEGRYVNMNDVERYLVKGSRTYFGDYLIYIARRDYADYDNIADNLTAIADR